jgi:hypothetical protein
LPDLERRENVRTITCTWSVAAVLLPLLVPAIAAAVEQSAGRSGTGSSREMIQALEAGGPHESIQPEAKVFDRFVGAWDLEGTFTSTDGTITRFNGAWIFGWVLDGRALQDVLIQNTGSGEQKRGTTVRFFDRKTNAWRIIWIPPASGQVVMLIGGPVGDRIVLEGKDPEGAQLRWSFNDLRTNSFYWRGEISHDEGKTWRIEQEMWLKRRTPVADEPLPEVVGPRQR